MPITSNKIKGLFHEISTSLQVDIERFNDSNPTLEVTDPFTDLPIFHFSPDSFDTISESIESSLNAVEEWNFIGLDGRIKIITSWLTSISKQRIMLARLLSQESGLPILSATREVENIFSTAEFFAKVAPKMLSAKKFEVSGGFAIVSSMPLGAALCITSFNVPLTLFAWKVFPALLAGCSVLVKPDPRTPLSTLLLVESTYRFPLLRKVLAVAVGDGSVGKRLVSDPRFSAISFTGSNKVGVEISRVAAKRFAKLTLELGGVNRAFVLSDIAPMSVHKVAAALFRRSFYLSGQYCLRISNIFIHASVFEIYKNLLIKFATEVQVGDPSKVTTAMGPLIDRNAKTKILAQIDQALSSGCSIEFDGREKYLSHPTLLAPIILSSAEYDSSTSLAEIFGPVVILHKLDSDVTQTSCSEMAPNSLATYFFTGNISKMQAMALQMKTCNVWINEMNLSSIEVPHSVRGECGIGFEKSDRAFEAFTYRKSLYVPNSETIQESPMPWPIG